MERKGYALIDDKQEAFSWHPTFEDAQIRCAWENKIMGRNLHIVKDVEAIWPVDCERI